MATSRMQVRSWAFMSWASGMTSLALLTCAWMRPSHDMRPSQALLTCHRRCEDVSDALHMAGLLKACAPVHYAPGAWTDNMWPLEAPRRLLLQVGKHPAKHRWQVACSTPIAPCSSACGSCLEAH